MSLNGSHHINGGQNVYSRTGASHCLDLARGSFISHVLSMTTPPPTKGQGEGQWGCSVGKEGNGNVK